MSAPSDYRTQSRIIVSIIVARHRDGKPFVKIAHGSSGSLQKPPPVLLRDITAEEETRIDLRDEEFNRVLGGGLVKGSIVLIGGEPGIGKSTLVMQTVLKLGGLKTLYVSGEESGRQLKLRADRMALTI